MPSTISDRVVRMEFDNAQFERNVRTSMHTIDELKRKLDFSGSVDSFNELERTSGNLRFESISNALDNISSKFSLWGIVAKTTIENVTNQVLYSAKKMAAALSIDQMAAGFSQYESKMTNMAKLMNSVSNEDFYMYQANAEGDLIKQLNKNGDAMVDYVKKREYVEGQLEKIYWFSDETSADSNSLLNNLSSLTNAGQTVEDAVEIEMGLTNMVMAAGGNAETANRVMYQLFQSLGKNYVGREDWSSVLNSGIVSEQLMQQIMDIAASEEVGTLVKKQQEDGTFRYFVNTEIDEATGELRKYKNGIELTTGALFDFDNATEITFKNFAQSLTETRWFNNDTLFGLGKRQGNFSARLSEITQDLDKTYDAYMRTDSWIKHVENYTNTAADDVAAREEIAKRAADEAGIDDWEQMMKWIDELSGSEYSYGLHQLKETQKTKTWSEALEATKKAATTAWSRIAESIFGDSEESVKLFSNIVEDLYKYFVEPINMLRDSFKDWEGVGYELLWGSDNSAYSNLKAAFEGFFGENGIVKRAFESIFGEIDEERITEFLIKITEGLRDFTASLIPTKETAEKFQKILEGVFAIIDIGRELINGIKIALTHVFDLVKNIFGLLFGLSAEGGGWLVSLRDTIKENKTFEVVGTEIANVLSTITGFIWGMIEALSSGSLGGFFEKAFGTIGTTIDRTLIHLEGLGNVLEALFGTVGKVIKFLLDRVSDLFETTETGETRIERFFAIVLDFLDRVGAIDVLKQVVAAIGDHIADIVSRDNGEFLKSLLVFVLEALSLTASILQTAAKAATVLIRAVRHLFETIESKLNTAGTDSRLSVLWDFLVRIGDELINFILPSVDDLQSTLSKIHFKDIVKYATMFVGSLAPSLAFISETLLVLKAIQSFENMQWAFGNMFSPFMGINASLSSLSEVIDSWNKKTQAKTVKIITQSVLMLALAMTVFAVALKLLSTIPFGPAIGALILFASILTMVTLVMVVLANTFKANAVSAKAVKSAMSSFAGIALAILGIAFAISILAEYEWDELLGATIMLGVFAGVILGVIVAVAAMEAKTAPMLAAAGAFMIMALAVSVMAGALAVLALVNWDTLWKGAASLGAIIVIMGVLALALGGLQGWGLAGAAALLIIAIAMLVFANALLTTAKAIGIFAVAVVGSLYAFSLINSKDLAENFGVVTMALSEFVKALAEGLSYLTNKTIGAKLLGMDKFFLVLSIAIVAAGLGVYVLAEAVERLEKPLINIANALPADDALKLAGAFALMALASGLIVALLSKLKWWGLVGAATLAITVISIAFAIKLICDGIKKLSEIGPDGIDAITNSMKAFGAGVGEVIKSIVRGVVDAIPIIFEGVRTFFTELQLFLPKWLMETTLELLTQMEIYLPQILEKLKSILDTFNAWLSDDSDKAGSAIGGLLAAIVMLMDNLAAKIREKKGEITAATVNLMDALIDLAAGILIDLQLAKRLGYALWNGTTEGFEEAYRQKQGGTRTLIGALADDLVAGAVQVFTGNTKLAAGAGAIADAIFSYFRASSKGENVGGFFDYISQAYYDATTDFEKRAEILADTAPKKTNPLNPSNWYNELVDSTGRKISGSDQKHLREITENLMRTLKPTEEDKQTVLREYVRLGVAIPEVLRDYLEIHSPSRVMADISHNAVLGLVKGLGDSEYLVTDSADELSMAIESALANALAILDEDGSINPVIAPVLDLTNIQNGTGLIDSAMSGYSVSASVDGAASVSRGMNSRIEAANEAAATANTTSNVSNVNTFYITGDDPKQIAEEVSRILQRQVSRRDAQWA